MSAKSLIGRAVKQVPGAMALALAVKKRIAPPATDAYEGLDRRSDQELMAIVRHEAHRIEKSMYNDIFDSKRAAYEAKRDRVLRCFGLLESRGINPAAEPTLRWAGEIIDSFDSLDDFISKNSRAAAEYTPGKAPEFAALVRLRRSCRVWAEQQPPLSELRGVAEHMIDAARWAPTSGNRQPWRFFILTDPDRKELLRGIKEEHCISAPLLIWVVMDRRVYGALGKNECSLFIDAGAAIMQMVLTAHACGLGVCWNHFAIDMITSRPKNVRVYRRFAGELGAPDYLESVAIVAIGRPEFVPPEPARTEIDDLVLKRC